jgi:hypothetical protein
MQLFMGLFHEAVEVKASFAAKRQALIETINYISLPTTDTTPQVKTLHRLPSRAFKKWDFRKYIERLAIW